MTLKNAALCFGLITALVIGPVVAGASLAIAAPITYSVNQSIRAGSVVGTIETNGTIGALTSGDIIAWSLALNGVGATYNITNSNSVVDIVGGDLTATALDLSFNFSGADSGYVLFQDGLKQGKHYYCDAASSGTCFQGASVVPESFSDPSAQFMPTSGAQVIGTAVSVPEPASLALLGLGLAGFGALSRRRTRTRC